MRKDADGNPAGPTTAPPWTTGRHYPAPIPHRDRRRWDLETLSDDYTRRFARLEIRPGRHDAVAWYLTRLTRPAALKRYRQLGVELGVPWDFIGILHAMESTFDFHCHLHNGDPLSDRTVRVPQDRPPEGDPPFTWEASCRDALGLAGFAAANGWSLPQKLYRFERYNGFGYRPHGIPSPYLWSFSTHYLKGKFVRDGHFDPGAVSEQCGAAVLLKALHDAGHVR